MFNIKAVSTWIVGVSLALGGVRVTDAGAWSLQASSGHRWNANDLGGLVMNDASICTQSSFNVENVPYYWVVPVPLSETDAWYVGTQAATGDAETRLVSFNDSGSVYMTSDYTTSSDEQALGWVYVPPNGTLFIQSVLTTRCGESVCPSACVNSVRAE